MGALDAAGSPLENLHNRAVLGLTRGDGVVGCQTFGAQKGNMFASELQQISFSSRVSVCRRR